MALRKLNKSLSKEQKVDPLHQKTVFLIKRSHLEQLLVRDTSNVKSTKFENKIDQFNQFLTDLKEWGGYSNEQLTKLDNKEKAKDTDIALI